MTRTLLSLGAAAFLALGANAQGDPLTDFVEETRGDTLVIKDFFDANGTASTLGAVIAADTNAPEGRVYLLKKGANGALDSGSLSLYLFDAGITEQGRPLNIAGEYCGLMVQGDDPDCRPPSIAGYIDGSNAGVFASFAINDDITMRNLHFTSAHTLGESNWSFLAVNGDNLDITWDNVLGEHNRWTFSESNENNGTNYYISNSYFVNATDQPSRRNGGIYDNVQAPTGTMIVENTTHVQNAGMQYKFRDYSPTKVRFNHNTWVNAAGQSILTFGYLTDFAATNNLFVNSNYQPYYPGLDSGETYTNPASLSASDFQPHGIINLAPLRTNDQGQSIATTPESFPEVEVFDESDRMVLVEGNAVYWDPVLMTIADNLNAAGVEGTVCAGDGCLVDGTVDDPVAIPSLDWMDQTILYNDRTEAIFDDNETYPLITEGVWYQEGAPGFTAGPETINPNVVQELYNWGYASASSDVTNGDLLRKVRTTGNEAGLYIDNEDTNNWIIFDWPIPLDLSYSNQAYLTGAYDGYPVGDLNWFPAQKTAWMATRDQEYADIDAALASGNRILPTAGEDAPSMIGRLGQNRPNPFSSSTTIEFELVSPTTVSLDVYDALGRRVATLASGEMAAGPHSVDFDAGSLSNGVYIYTLRAGGTVESRRMVVTR